jgi:hypothetical protein
MTAHRVRVVPWLRRPGRLLLRDWLAITLGHTIFTWRSLGPIELAHELEHVRQWERHGAGFVVAYLTESVRARRAGGHWYRDNRFEREARKAAEAIQKG